MVLIGKSESLKADAIFIYDIQILSEYVLLNISLQGSLGARINELKQRVIAENPHRYAVAVPRKSVRIFTLQCNRIKRQAKCSFFFFQC